jgi:hypothetical protein
MLNKEQILECEDIKTEMVQVPEWGGEVAVKGLTLAEKDAWTTSIIQDGEANVEGATAKLCIMCMVGEDGGRLFDLEDVDFVQTKSAAALDRVFQVAQRLSGIGQEDIEETVKNSEKTTTPGSD